MVSFLQMTEAILPCPLCQNHYRQWIKENPLRHFLDIKNPVRFYDVVRTWLWRLHDSINHQRGVEQMSFDDAVALYATKTTDDLQQALVKLLEVLDRAKLQRLIDGAHIRDWRTKLSNLRRLIRI